MLGELEADIFSRVIDPSNPSLTPEAAAGLLSLSYSEADHQRMGELAAKSNTGTLTPQEHRELEGNPSVELNAATKARAGLR